MLKPVQIENSNDEDIENDIHQVKVNAERVRNSYKYHMLQRIVELQKQAWDIRKTTSSILEQAENMFLEADEIIRQVCFECWFNISEWY